MVEEIGEGAEQEAGLAEEVEEEVDQCKRCDYLAEHSFALQVFFLNVHWNTNISLAQSYMLYHYLYAAALFTRHTTRPSTKSKSRIQATQISHRSVRALKPGQVRYEVD